MNMPNPSDQLTTLNLINRSLKRVLPNSQALSLAIILLVSFVFIYSLADLLMPVFVSIGLAYLLEGIVRKLEHLDVPRIGAVAIVFSLFL